MIDTSPSSIRVFLIIVLGTAWIYLLVEYFAIKSMEDNDRR